MSAVKEMSDLFSAVAEKDAVVTKQIEAVMLHVRARQMLPQERKHILISVRGPGVRSCNVRGPGVMRGPGVRSCAGARGQVV